MLSFILIVSIALAIYFILFFLRQTLFVDKHRYVSSNTLRAYAFFLDMILLNLLNLGYWLIFALNNEEVKEELTQVVNIGFHGAGEGLGSFFLMTQSYVLLSYFVYALVCELTGLRSTILGYFLGLRVRVKESSRSIWLSIIVRGVLKPVSLVLFPLTLVLSYGNKNRKWLHDKIAGTWVEKVN